MCLCCVKFNIRFHILRSRQSNNLLTNFSLPVVVSSTLTLLLLVSASVQLRYVELFCFNRVFAKADVTDPFLFSPFLDRTRTTHQQSPKFEYCDCCTSRYCCRNWCRVILLLQRRRNHWPWFAHRLQGWP